MKIVKMFLFDVKNGVLGKTALLISPVILAVFFIMGARNSLAYFRDSLTYGELLVYVYGGMQPYEPSFGDPFAFPLIWLCVSLICSYLILHYPIEDLHGYGTKVVVHSKMRVGWWLCKCAWCIVSTLLYHLLIIAVLTLGALFFHMEMRSDIRPDVLAALYPQLTCTASPALSAGVIFSCLMVFVALNLLQMLLLLFTKPVIAYLPCCVCLLSSAYYMAPYFIGNYAMSARSAAVLTGGFPWQTGVWISFGLSALFIIIGAVRFKRYDIF